MLAEELSLTIFHILVVFARLGAMLMVMPGFSAGYVAPRIRLLLGLAATLVMTPALAPVLPAPPAQASALALLIVFEAFYGAFFGMIAQALMAALHLAGTSIGQSIGLMNAMVFDPITEQQGALIIGLLTNVAILCIFVMDLHHVMFAGIMMSYQVFAPGTAPAPEDHMTFFVDVLTRSFHIGLRLASPFVVFAIVFQSVMGLMSRLSPQMNIFFVALPVQILLGVSVLWIVLPAMILWFLTYYEDTLLLIQ